MTLIELLIVVSIIVLLISILVPSLRGARAQARMVVCLNNCKQMGLAMQLYSMQNRDRFPSSGGHGSDADPRNWWLNVLNRYVNEPLVFECPSERGVDFVDWTHIQWEELPAPQRDALAEMRWGSYALNYLVAERPDPYCDNLSRIRHPAHTIFVAESCSQLRGVDHIHPERFVMMPPERQVAIERHRGMANYLFADTHVDTLGFGRTWKPLRMTLWDPKTAPQWNDRFLPPPDREE